MLEVSERMFWGSKGAFTSKELTKEVHKLHYHGALVDNLVSSVWIKLTPPKVEFFMWLALLGKLNTKDLLLKKGILPPQENSCSFCASHTEDLTHLLVLCPMSWHIWVTLARDLGVAIAQPANFRLFYERWVFQRFKNQMRRKL